MTQPINSAEADNTLLSSTTAIDHMAEGRRLLDEKDYSGAIRHYLKAHAEQPDNPRTTLGLGIALSQAEHHNDARITLEHALLQAPEDPDYAFALGEAHERAGKLDVAEKIYRQTLLGQPQHLLTAHNLGVLLYKTDRLAEAARQHLETLGKHPDSPPTWRDLGQSLVASGRLNEGIATLETAHEIFPHDRQTCFALGLAYLRNEEWEKGWPLYETRWLPREKQPTAPGSIQWQGESLQHKHLLITREQGFGDNLMFVRYLPTLAQEAAQITLLAPKPLTRLFAESFAKYHNVSVTDQAEYLPIADYSCSIGSLALHCLSRNILAPPNEAYLTPQHSVLSNKNNATGIVWRGNTAPQHLRWRSFNLQSFLAKLPGDTGPFVSLQLDPTAEEQAQLAAYGIIDQTSAISDFSDTAAQLANLNALITVDTAIAHLAGAIGCNTTVLLRPAGDWRWGKNQTGQAWYKKCFSTHLNVASATPINGRSAQ